MYFNWRYAVSPGGGGVVESWFSVNFKFTSKRLEIRFVFWDNPSLSYPGFEKLSPEIHIKEIRFDFTNRISDAVRVLFCS